MNEQEESDRKALETTRAMTVGELMDMRAELDARFAEKLGREPAAGFHIEISGHYPDRVKLWGGYESFGSGFSAVVPSTDYMGETPQEAFSLACEKIDAFKVPTKSDKIAALKEQIAELEKDQ